MQRNCDAPGCGKPYEAKRANSQYCSQTCGRRARRQGKSATVTALPAPEPSDSPLETQVRTELEEAGRLNTTLGAQAVAIASRMANSYDTGSSMASLSRELRAVMAEAMAGAAQSGDALDELKARRAVKRNAG